MTESQVEEFERRQIALSHAVGTHGHWTDENLIVKAAQAYLSFLKSEEVGQVHGQVAHHPV